MCRTTWVGQAWRPSVLIQSSGADDGPNRVTISNSVAKPLDDEDSEALASSIAVGLLIKTPTSRVRREEAHIAHHEHIIGMIYKITSTDETLRIKVCLSK